MVLDSESAAPDRIFIGELAEARNSGRRVPDFFVVGHAKCGTTALYEMLKQHPQIYMPAFKETQFLSRGPNRARVRQKRAPLRPQTLDGYLAMYASAAPQQRAGDGSTEYLRTPATARRIAALSPDAQIVAAFREPISFLRSLHLQLLEVNIEDEPDFEKALRLEEPRRNGRHIPRNCVWPQALQYTQHVRYEQQLREYHEQFGRERVLVLIYDDFRADNERTLKEVLRFLEIDDSVAIKASEANPTVRVRSRHAGSVVGALSTGGNPLARTAGRALKAATSEPLRRRALAALERMSRDAKPAGPNEQLLEDLRGRFVPEVTAISEYLGRDLLSLWGYERDRPDAVAPAAGNTEQRLQRPAPSPPA
jgi:Sulfotransferase family